eukprot:sb/3477516/
MKPSLSFFLSLTMSISLTHSLSLSVCLSHSGLCHGQKGMVGEDGKVGEQVCVDRGRVKEGKEVWEDRKIGTIQGGWSEMVNRETALARVESQTISLPGAMHSTAGLL